jgi:serine/threonine-protein kinase
LERALELDPLNLNILQAICFSYECLRRFSEAAAILDRAQRIAPNDIGTRISRAEIDLWWRADPKPLHSTVQAIMRENSNAAGNVADRRLQLALCERDPNEARQAVTSMSSDGSYNNGFFYPRGFSEGLVARLGGDQTEFRSAFMRARTEVEKLLAQQPNYPEALCILGLIDAALGHKENAIREGQRALELLPPEKDAINGVIVSENLALIYAWLGQKGLALAQLATAAQLPGDVNYGYLRLHPYWDALRGDRRFEKIVASLAPDAKKP